MGLKRTGTELIRELGANIKGKIVLVTGTSPGGIGALYAEKIVQAGPSTLILTGRSTASIQKTVDAVTSAAATANTPLEVKTLVVDFASFESVRHAAGEVNGWADVPHIDVLVNNAGIMATSYGMTKDGFEMQFGVNHLGPYLFTNLLMRKVLASASPRVVMVGSDGHRLSPIRWADYNFKAGKTYNKWQAYGQSKTANNLTAVGLARRLSDKGLQAFSLHPGVYLGSNLARDVHIDPEGFSSLKAADAMMGNHFANDDFQFDFHNEDEIISTMIYASFTDELKDHNGAHLHSCRVADQFKEEVWPRSIDKIEAEKLWTLSEKLVGQEFRY